MGFQLDNSSFMQGAQLKQRQQENFFDAITRGIQMAQREDLMDLKKQRILADQADKANDPKALADSGMMKLAQGIPLSPQEEAAVDVYQAKLRPTMDPNTGNMMGAPDIRGSLSRKKGSFDFDSLVPVQQETLNMHGTYDPSNQMGTRPIDSSMFDSLTATINTDGMNPKERQLVKEELIKDEFAQIQEARRKENPLSYSDGQSQAANFANRMVKSRQIMDNMLGKDPKADRGQTGIAGSLSGMLTALPLGDTGAALGEYGVRAKATPEQQQYLNAAQNWLSANLRKESGAVIGADEMRQEYAKYFPVVGDGDEVIKQKAELRREAEKGMINQSAGLYQKQYGAKAKAAQGKKFPPSAEGKKVRYQGKIGTIKDGRFISD